MKPLNELLGFAALTGPLWLIFLFLPIGIWIAWKLAKRFTSVGTRLAVGLGTFLLFFCVPFADEIAGRIYFNHLCATEAGVKVYHTVELPAEYWDEKGKPRFYDETNGNLRLPTDKYEWSSSVERYQLGVEKNISFMREKNKGDVLNERVLFTYWGGWLSRNFTPNHSAMSCSSDVKAYTRYVNQIFAPIHSENSRQPWRGI